jgi:hypothetical protein
MNEKSAVMARREEPEWAEAAKRFQLSTTPIGYHRKPAWDEWGCSGSVPGVGRESRDTG